ncbi:ABC transporter ATP-binding protein [Hominifimenecus sp. rT4P-3]|uniref:ABC transporter ATP-binding protein n=1 Tax=Hominifimenecus sp. rT4P-3 TaxID=3242979 RepID=UPI003DA5EBED
MSRIEARGVEKSYGAVHALKQVSLTLEENKIYGLLGRNGAGKSTLLKILAGWIFPDQGEAAVDGVPVLKEEDRMGDIYLMSEQNLYPDGMDVRAAIRYGTKLYPEFDSAYAMRLAEKFKLPMKTGITKLSTGYRSIFKVIMALSVNTPVVFFDEPVLGLDANHRELFYRVFLEKYAERPFTAVISTHLIDEVANVVEDVILLRKGEIIYQGSREALLEQGYAVSGKAADVDSYQKGRPVIAEESFGGLKAAYFWGEKRPEVLPEGLELSNMDLQKLFIRLTGEEGEE